MTGGPTSGAPQEDLQQHIAVLGIGNVLLSDDAFGPYVVELLRTGYDWPHNVTLLDVGTPGLDLPGYMHGCSLVVLVDAVADDAPPGTVRVLDRAQIDRLPMAPRVSPHDPVLREALCIADLSDAPPGAIVLVGAVPESLEVRVGLSPAMRRAVDEAVERVREILAVHGATGVPRDTPAPLDVWWRATTSQDLR